MEKRVLPWTRVFAEFLVIFVGVTLGLFADDWRQEQETRSVESALLESLASDLAADSIELAAVAASARTWDIGASWFKVRSGDGTPVPTDSVSVRFRQVLFYGLYQPVSAAYVSLKEGGQLASIRDPALRAEISRYYEQRQTYMVQFNDLAMAAYLPWRAVAFEYVDVVQVGDTLRHWPIEGFRLVKPWEQFREDPRVRPKLTDLGISGANFAARITDVLSDNSALRASIRFATAGS